MCWRHRNDVDLLIHIVSANADNECRTPADLSVRLCPIRRQKSPIENAAPDFRRRAAAFLPFPTHLICGILGAGRKWEKEMKMKMTVSRRDSAIIVDLDGQLDGNSSPDIQEQIMALLEPDARIVLDMSDVTYMSSAGLRVLLILARRLEATGSRVVLVGLMEEVQDTMSITGFLGFFTVWETVEEGLRALSQPG
jgi:anti-sigma B factor antagonist